MVFTGIDNITVWFICCIHTCIILHSQKIIQVYICPSSITCVNSMDVSYIPIAKARGFTTHQIIFVFLNAVSVKRQCLWHAAFSTRSVHLLSTLGENSPAAQTVRWMVEISTDLLTKTSLSSLRNCFCCTAVLRFSTIYFSCVCRVNSSDKN